MSVVCFDKKEYVHPLDRTLIERVYQNELVRKWMDSLFQEGLDEVCEYAYSSSYLQIDAEDALCRRFQDACERFGVSRDAAQLYYKRSYDYDVSLAGYANPKVLVPELLLERRDEAIINGRLGAAAAAIGAGHPRLSFLLWILENMEGALNIPFLNHAFLGVMYEWKRCRVYTLDRAFLLATGDYALTLQNILYGAIPFDALERFRFGDADDTFMAQVQSFQDIASATGLVGSVFSFFQDYAWLPQRYNEIRKFYRER